MQASASVVGLRFLQHCIVLKSNYFHYCQQKSAAFVTPRNWVRNAEQTNKRKRSFTMQFWLNSCVTIRCCSLWLCWLRDWNSSVMLMGIWQGRFGEFKMHFSRLTEKYNSLGVFLHFLCKKKISDLSQVRFLTKSVAHCRRSIFFSKFFRSIPTTTVHRRALHGRQRCSLGWSYMNENFATHSRETKQSNSIQNFPKDYSLAWCVWKGKWVAETSLCYGNRMRLRAPTSDDMWRINLHRFDDTSIRFDGLRELFIRSTLHTKIRSASTWRIDSAITFFILWSLLNRVDFFCQGSSKQLFQAAKL